MGSIGVTWLITMGGVDNRPLVLRRLYFASRKTGEFSFFSVFTPPKEPVIKYFYFFIYHSLTKQPPPQKKLFLRKKNIGRAFSPLPHSPIHPKPVVEWRGLD
jgi:hypothetical protein